VDPGSPGTNIFANEPNEEESKPMAAHFSEETPGRNAKRVVFFYIKNHWESQEFIDQVFMVTRQFFTLSIDEKIGLHKIRVGNSATPSHFRCLDRILAFVYKRNTYTKIFFHNNERLFTSTAFKHHAILNYRIGSAI
jgi:isopenicillin N synthase-like dioxygenase